MRHLLLSFIVVFVPAAHGQVYTMLQSEVNACSGVLYDSGGPTASYPNDANETLVLCPDAPGMRVSLQFTTFQLSLTAIATSDFLRIYDGSDANAPLLGSYHGNTLSGALVQASDFNPSGCLFLQFVSNQAGTGDIAATISCLEQCAPPTAVLATAGDTMITCSDIPLALDFTGSTAAAGHTITSVTWQGLPQTAVTLGTWPEVGLLFTTSGIHRLRGRLVDDTGCASEPVALTVVVTPAVDFTGTSAPSEVCPGAEVALSGQATMDTLVQVVRAQQFHEPPFYLADDVGTPYTSSLVVTDQPVGSVLTDPADLGEICLTLEHSHIGDLVVRLICPSGLTAVLHQQGGGPTMLGDANDFDDGNAIPGTCWTYCFSENPDFGRWDEHCASCISPNVTSVTDGTALLPGTYAPVSPLGALVGCPLNGTWTLEFIDLWAADNGFLCSWDLEFESELDSSFIHLTPGLDPSLPGSAAWTGTGVTQGTTGMTATAVSTDPGQESYTFTVVDSRGCVHDTTVQVTVLTGPLVEAGDAVSLCNTTGALNGSVELRGIDTCSYTLVLLDWFGDGWNGGANLVVRAGDINTTYSLSGQVDSVAFSVLLGDTLSLIYTAGSIFNNENSFSLLDQDLTPLYTSPQGPASGVLFTTTAQCSSLANTSLGWWPTTGLADPTSTATAVAPPANGWYHLTATNNLGCTAQDSVLVSAGGPPVFLTYDEGADALCLNPVTTTTNTWFLNGALYTTSENACLLEPLFGLWTVEAPLTVECPSLSPTFAYCPTLVIEVSEGQLSTTPGLGTYTWRWNGTVFAEGPQATVPDQGSGTYSVTLAMEQGCVVEATTVVDGSTTVTDTAPTGTELLVIPNPNTGLFNLLLPNGGGTGQVSVLDMAGRAVVVQQVPLASGGQSTTLSMALHAGVYMVEVRLGSTVHRTRMVVE